ncbi:MAG: gliding motility lipoprotein GldH [Cytophagales bacterium]|nr:MAG: gliding motility lipoprotein GldH [Cytophagales bacterium]
MMYNLFNRCCFIGFIFAVLLVFSGCDKKLEFSEVHDFSSQSWAEADVYEFDFDINTPKQAKDLYLLLRYDNQYNFYNLYIKYTLVDSTGKELLNKLDQLMLFEEKSGKPLGEGFTDTYDLEAKLFYLKNYSFPYAGKYSLKISQHMRISPLQGLKSVGLKIKSLE